MTVDLEVVADNHHDHVEETTTGASEENISHVVDPYHHQQHPEGAIVSSETTMTRLPDWVTSCASSSLWGEPLEVDEWQDDGGIHREKHGWKGRDLVHDRHAPVRVLEYYVQYGPEVAIDASGDTRPGGVGTTLSGVVEFTKRAESHQGYCHGGSMCSIMDDVIGWVAFCATGSCRPWTGFTVQVNTSLKKPIPVSTVLLIQATITQIDKGRKVFVSAKLVDPSDSLDKDDDVDDDDDDDQSTSEPVVHATGTGLVLLNRGVLPVPPVTIS